MSREDQATYDERTVNNVYTRNTTRIREIDATLNELRPLFSKLMNEREQCLAIANRTTPPLNKYGVSGLTGDYELGPQTPKAAAPTSD